MTVQPTSPRSTDGGLRTYFLLSSGPGRNPGMEGLRGYAVLLVVLLHCLVSFLGVHRGVNVFAYANDPVWTMLSKARPTDVMLICAAKAYHAVDLFFLLSAFLIARIVTKAGSNFSYRSFIWKRFLRIYPAFLVTLAAGIALRVGWLGTLSFSKTELLKNLLFLNGLPGYEFTVRSYNYPTWSLFSEFVFYLTFPFIFALQRRAVSNDLATRYLGGLALLATVLLFVTWTPRAALFVFGVVLGLRSDAELAQIARAVPTALAAGVYLLLFLAYALLPIGWNWFSPVFGVGASLLFLKVCYDGDSMLCRGFSWLPLRWVGNISFSLYLAHSLAIDLVAQHLLPSLTGISPYLRLPVFLIASIVLSFAFATVLFATVERWYLAGSGHKPRSVPVPEPLPAPRLAA